MTQQIHTVEQLLALHQPTALSDTLLQELQDVWSDFDFSIVEQVVFFDTWSGFEENSELCVFIATDGSLQMINTGYSVMDENRNEEQATICETTTPQEALDEINAIISNNEDMAQALS